MVTERAVFTAIPAGRDPATGHLRVTVFVTPRLSTGTGGRVELAAFEAFSSWPRTVADARFGFEVDGAGQVEGFPPDDAVVPDAELWDSLLGRAAVGDGEFQHFEKATVHSFPVAEIADAVTALYRDVAAASPSGFPTLAGAPLATHVARLRSPLGRLEPRDGGHRRAVKEHLAALRAAHDPGKGRFVELGAVPAAERPALAFLAAADFYDRSDDPWDDATAHAKVPDPVPPELHSFVARCADFPELLRRLGLAIDVLVKDDPAIAERGLIRVLAGWNGGLLEDLLAPDEARPSTRVHRTERVWAPGSRTERPDIVDGSLVVDDTERFLVEQIDPDGAALKVGNLLVTLEHAAHDAPAPTGSGKPSMTPGTSSLPALRSTGFVVARRDRAAATVGQLDASAAHEAAHDAGVSTTLDAADVTRGWRLDVRDDRSADGRWLSLHRRTGVYELVAPDGSRVPLPGPQPGPDEGHLKAASMSSPTAGTGGDQYLHETLIGWDGWSLAAKRPGKVVDETGPVLPPATYADQGFPLAVRFRPEPGTLPRLRYGRRYDVRVRAVDLSGRSIPDDQLDEQHERKIDLTYQRWDPVPSPVIVPLTEYTEGESSARLVLRSTLGVPVAEYVALARVTTLPGHTASGDVGIVYRTENERNLAAPVGSVQLAETHGMLDAALAGDPVAVAAQLAVATRESESFLTLPGARVVNPHGEPAAIGAAKGTPLPQGQYVVHPNRALTLPYLPDPLARGVTFATLPGDAGPRRVRWPGAGTEAATWFDRQPVLLRIVEGSDAPVWDAAARTLTVALPQATIARVAVSSFLDRADVELMRVWHLIDEQVAPASAADRERVERGGHWMVTPWTELTLVHAVEKPLAPPVLVVDGSTPLRRVGATYSVLPGVLRNHAASTGRLDVDARWSDPVDDVLEPAPRDEPKSAHVGDLLVDLGEDAARLAESYGPADAGGGPRHEMRHELGDTRHRKVAYTPTATTRFREYFPPTITDDPALTTHVGDPVDVDVPSSARPSPPDVRYLVPFWEWRTETLDVESPCAVRRVRTAGGLRVYLGRGWFSSGPGEMLAVVLARQARRTTRPVGPGRTLPGVVPGVVTGGVGGVGGVGGIGGVGGVGGIGGIGVGDHLATLFATSAEGRRFTTTWGADPVVDGDPVPAGPAAEHFPRRETTAEVRLAEVTTNVTVVGHKPVFDPGRKLWFCDVALDVGDAYMPVVQLALARYQPCSVPGVELSTVVRADWAQPLPRREATFVVSPDRTTVAVTLAGVVGVPEHAVAEPSLAAEVGASRRVDVWVERAPGDATSDLDWTVVGAPVALDVRLTLSALRERRFRDVEWAGVVALPDPAALRDGDRVRVRLTEHEIHEADASRVLAHAPGRTGRGQRLVHADSVEIT